MHIWVDADACPATIKEILYRAVRRTKINLTLVTNQSFQIPNSIYIKILRVGLGFDVADNKIVQIMEPGDLVITADIPLADQVIQKGGIALNPRGELYTLENIKQRLSARNFSESLRSSGMMTKGPVKLGPKDNQAFANQLDRILTHCKA